MGSIHIGSVYQSNNSGSFIVLEKCDRTDFYKIKFIDTDTIKDVRTHNIISGSIRDPYRKSVYGVACTGRAKTNGSNKKLYDVWHQMISRCYNKNDKRYFTYRNVTVCDDWLIFENFLNDAKSIDGFDDELFNSGELVLDKDMKQRFYTQKVYSKETCIWLNWKENCKIQDAQQKEFYAISPDGELFFDYNIADFARKHNLDASHISGVLHGRNKHHKGWKFSYEEMIYSHYDR